MPKPKDPLVIGSAMLFATRNLLIQKGIITKDELIEETAKLLGWSKEALTKWEGNSS